MRIPVFDLPRPAIVLGWLMAAAAVAAAVIMLFHGAIIVDDAYITFRYAWNAVNGHGLVFNVGERVEGMTNLSWTLIAAVVIRAGLPVDSVMILAGLGLALLALRELWHTSRAIGATPEEAAVPVLAIAIVPPFWLFAANGLEGGLVAFLLTRVLRCALTSRFGQAGVMSALLFATRPDTLPVAPLVAVWSWLSHRRAAHRTSANRQAAQLLVPWTVIVGVLSLWRIAYYGRWLPNTIQAKFPPPRTDVALLLENASDGLSYIVQFALSVPLQSLAVLVAGLAGPVRSLVLLALALPAALVPALLINGGDWVPHHRLLMPYLPALSLAVPLALRRLWQGRPRGRVGVVAAVLLLLPVPSVLSLTQDPAWRWRPAVTTELDPACWGALASHLAPQLTPDDRVGVEVLGILAFRRPDVYVHDLLSLTDPVGASRGRFYMPRVGKFDPRHTLEAIRPTMIVFGADAFFLPALRSVADVSFDSAYRTFEVAISGPGCAEQPLFVSVSPEAQHRVRQALSAFAMRPYADR